MNICPYCNNEVEDHWKYCHNCFRPLLTSIETLKSNHKDAFNKANLIPNDDAMDTTEIESEITEDFDARLQKQLKNIDLKIDEKVKKGEAVGQLLLNKASIYYKHRKFDLALTQIELALKNFNDVGDKINEAISHNEMGLIYEDIGFFDQAIYHFDISISILKEVKDNKKLVQVLNNLANIYLIMDDIQASYAHYQSALEYAESGGLEEETVKTATNLVEPLLLLKDYERIQKILQSNLEYFKIKEDIYGIIQVFIKYGKLFYEKGANNYDRSYKYFNDALEIIESIKDQVSIFVSSHLEWECYLYLGKLSVIWANNIEAEDYLLKSLEAIRTFEAREDLKESIVLEELARFYKINGNSSKAVEYFLLSSEIYDKYGNQDKKATIYEEVGKIYFEMQEKSQIAQKYLEKSLEIFEEKENLKQAADLLFYIGSKILMHHDIPLASSYLERALLYYQDMNDYLAVNKVRGKLDSLNERQEF